MRLRQQIQLPAYQQVGPVGIRLSLCLIASAVVATDYWIVRQGRYTYGAQRLFPAVAALVAIVAIARRKDAWPDIAWRPQPTVAYWLKATGVLALSFAVLLGLTVSVALVAGATLEPVRLFGLRELVVSVVVAPVVEEPIYRLALCLAVVLAWGPWHAVVASGIAFGALHFLYGSPGSNNVVAGFVLGWAFLKSRSLAVPIVLHALGNLAVTAINEGWYRAT